MMHDFFLIHDARCTMHDLVFRILIFIIICFYSSFLCSMDLEGGEGVGAEGGVDGLHDMGFLEFELAFQGG